jgi:polyphosphate kinase 2 (PPK2 family)
MFEMIEAAKDLSKAEYDKKVGKLRPALLDIQQKLRERKDLAVVILLNGVEGAGKSETMQFLTSWLDPRGIEVNAFGTEVECDRKPPFRQFWMHLPPKGKMGIFFGSWYTYPIVDRAFRKLKKSRFMLEIDKINTFERHLTAENVLIIKFWLHVSKKAQHERLKKLMKDPNRSWQITKREVKLSKHYDVL